MAHGNKTTKVPAELESAAMGGIVASADGIFDYNENKTQEELNQEFKENSGYVKPEGGIPKADLSQELINEINSFITNTVSNLVNYYTKAESYTKSEITSLLNAIKQFTYEYVNTLPEPSSLTTNKIYLVPSEDSDENNTKDEYITILSNGSYRWEPIGNTNIDLSGYLKTTDIAPWAKAINKPTYTALEVGALPDSTIIPKSLSELNDDANHRTVSDLEKETWNTGGGGNPVDNEDLTLVEQDGVNVIKFKDKAYTPLTFSGLGRKYLRKNIQTVAENTLSNDYEYTTRSFIDIANVNVGGIVNMTPSSLAGSAHCVINVSEGDSFFVSGRVNGASHRVWGFVDNSNVLLLKNNTQTISLAFGSEIAIAPSDGKLIVNTFRPFGVDYRVAKIVPGEEKELNILTQEMFDTPNTTYIIQYDYTLNFGSIRLPEGSVLVFEGGSIINGGLVGNKSIFVNNYNKPIFNLDTYISGTWENTEFYPELFGAVGNGVMDCYLHIQKCLDTIHTISNKQTKTCVLNNSYKISNGLHVYKNTHIVGNAINTWNNGVYTLIADFENKMQWVIDSANISQKDWQIYPIGEFCPYNAYASANSADQDAHLDEANISITNVSIHGIYSTTTEDSTTIKHFIYGGVRVQRSLHSHLKDVFVDFVWIGIAHASMWYPSDRDLWVRSRNIGIYYATDTNHFTLYNCYIDGTEAYNYNNVDLSEYGSVPGQLSAPTSIVVNSSSGNIINPITEHYANAYSVYGHAVSSSSDNKGASIYISHPYIEGSFDTFFTLDEYTKCVVLNGVYVYSPKKEFAKYLGNGAHLRVIGFNDIYKTINTLNYSNAVHFDNAVTTSNVPEINGNFGHKGNLVYSTVKDKMYMIGSGGTTGIDGYAYQTQFIGNETPLEDSIKIGTPFIMQQSDRYKPVFESSIGTGARIKISISTLPSQSGNVEYTILGTKRTVNITYFDGITKTNVAAQIFKAFIGYYKCWNNPADTATDLFIKIPYTQYIESDDKTCSYADTGNTGMVSVINIDNNNPARRAQYVDFMGNAPEFEYKFSELPQTALEGTIGYWTAIQQPVYFKNGGWYDFPTNTKQEIAFEFSDGTTEKTASVAKTGGTLTYTVKSVLGSNYLNVLVSTSFSFLVGSTVTDNQNGTYTIALTVNSNVYTSNVEIPIYLQQQGTGKTITVTLTVAAADEPTNIVVDNETVKSKFLVYDTNSNGELSYDEALSVTTITNKYANIVGTSSNRIIIDFRVFPNLKSFNCNYMYQGTNYCDIILPESFNNFSANSANHPLLSMGSNCTVVLLSATPVATYGSNPAGFKKIYVPDIAVDSYKNYIIKSGEYAYPKAKIFPISEIDDNALRAKLGLEPLTENEGE